MKMHEIKKWFQPKTAHDNFVAMRETAKHCILASVTIRPNGQKPLINFIEVRDVSTDTDAYQKIIDQYQLGQYPCSYVLNAIDYQCVHVEKPLVPADEVKQAVRWKIKDLIDYPVDDASLALLEIPSDENGYNQLSYLYVIAARNDRIGDISNRLIQQNVNLKVIDTKATAQRNIASFLEDENRAMAMLSLSSLGGLLTFTSGGELYHTRFIEMDQERSATSLERFALEMQRSLDYFDRQFAYVSVNKLLIAPFEYQQDFVDYLKNALYVPVESFNIQDIFDLAAGMHWPDAEMQASLLPVLGGALRQEEVA